MATDDNDTTFDDMDVDLGGSISDDPYDEGDEAFDDLDADVDLEPDDDEDTVSENDPPDPFMDTPQTGNLEVDTKAELDNVQQAIKDEYKRQDANQRAQYKNIYDAGYYISDVFRSVPDKEYGTQLMARVIGFDYKRTGSAGMWRNGHDVIRALEKFAQRLDIDISDLPKPPPKA